jgi:hypothetical protein
MSDRLPIHVPSNGYPVHHDDRDEVNVAFKQLLKALPNTRSNIAILFDILRQDGQGYKNWIAHVSDSYATAEIPDRYAEKVELSFQCALHDSKDLMKRLRTFVAGVEQVVQLIKAQKALE